MPIIYHKRSSINLFFTILFAAIAIIGLTGYFIFKPLLQQEPVVYRITENTEHTGGRGIYHTLSANYKGKVYKVDITNKMYDAINKGVLPDFYYSKTCDKLISEWTVEVCLRVSILFSILALTAFFIPFVQRK